MSSLMEALQKFEAAEANLAKLERLWSELEQGLPRGIVLGGNPRYEDLCRSFGAILAALPKIDGWRPEIEPPAIAEIMQTRLDLAQVGDDEDKAIFEATLFDAGRDLDTYRFRFTRKRRALVRDELIVQMQSVDTVLQKIREAVGPLSDSSETVKGPLWSELQEYVDQIEVLMGSGVRPSRWSDLRRHLAFGMRNDLRDILMFDWPQVKKHLNKHLYDENEPLPVPVDDLSSLVEARPSGSVTLGLEWENLDDEGFERLLFSLIAGASGYENPDWSMQTRAADRGRDLAAWRVLTDSLSGNQRQRVIIQCKHWLSKSVSAGDIAITKEKVKLWNNPRVDVLIIATSGRFSSDALQAIERHNADGEKPRIEHWPESHLERLLAANPALIAEFGLRKR